MATLPIKYFTFSTRYPQSGTTIQFGDSYEFNVNSAAPDQRTFLIQVQGMTYADEPPEGRSMAELEEFYQTHRTGVTFDFDHPVYGMLKCRFAEPLAIPEGIIGGTGALPTFQITLKEQP